MMMWMIRHIELPSGAHIDDFDDTGISFLYWSNEHGWSSREDAVVWPDHMKPIVGLPFGGEWVRTDQIDHAICVHCDDSHHVDADHECTGGM